MTARGKIRAVLRSDFMAAAGAVGVAVLLLLALLAPLLANARPLVMVTHGAVEFPFVRTLFAPDSPEKLVEQLFNLVLLGGVGGVILHFLLRKWRKVRLAAQAVLLLALLAAFAVVQPRLDKTDYRELARDAQWSCFAPIPYGPFEIAAEPNLKPGREHWLGTDSIGRSVASRMLYGARVSLAVGLISTSIALLIGAAVGMWCGYFRGATDLAVMRVVELVMCFPTFLLLLILMSLLKDRGFEQSIVVVICVIGLTGWIGMTQLVRGEVLKLRSLPYMQSCEVLGLPVWRTMMFHLLPNIAPPLTIMFSFGVAGAMLAESSLSFLGFGVQLPTASWGGLLRQAFDDDPLRNWHLALFPGLALFVALTGFNFLGEGLRRALDPRSGSGGAR